MKHCPVCHHEIDANFGMAQCSNCQTALFIDFSGNIAVGGSEDLPESPLIDFSADTMDPPEDTGVQDIELQDIELQDHEYSQVKESFIPEASTSETSDTPEASEIPQSFDAWNIEGSIDSPPATNNFTANHHASVFEMSASTAEMNYKINISGIDTSDLRKIVQESLRDSRLGLVHDEVLENIDQGTLIISGLNPVKASVLINSLKEFPLELNWELMIPQE